jgi:hypothetical protein
VTTSNAAQEHLSEPEMMHTDCLRETLDEAAGLNHCRDTDTDDELDVSHAMDATVMRAHMVELLYRTDLQGKRTR